MGKQISVIKDFVDWDDKALERWLGTITRRGTKYNYRSAFRAYALFTGMTASALVDEALEDVKRDPREKKDIVLRRLIDFYHWMKTEYPKKSKGRYAHKIIGKGVSDKLSHMYVSAMRSFYATFGVVVRMKGRHSLPRARVRNKRLKVNAAQVKVLVDHARTPRDRAIILVLFQGGMDVSTLCSLRYGDVAEGLKKNEHPLKLELFRVKTGVEYYTFLARDAVDALKAYIADLKARHTQLRGGQPLFLQERGKDRLRTHNVQSMMKNVARASGFIDKENNGKAFNPLGPHALRESFGGIMINSGVPDTIVDFWLGHSIGQIAEAYKGPQYESLKKMYLEREHLLSVSAKRLNEKEFDEKVSAKVDERVEVLRQILRRYEDENLLLQSQHRRTQEKIDLLEQKFMEMEKQLRQTREIIKELQSRPKAN